jgi:hypothetical protein
MGWIKRNLIFVIGGVVALGLLAASGFYIYKDWARNSEASAKLNENYGTLKNLQQQKPAPGNNKVNNTAIAKEQDQQVQAWIKSARTYFRPVPAIPSGTVTGEAFASALRRTVDQLQHEADDSSVTLPPKYDFSFSAQRPLVKFAAGSLGPLAVQLGEVKTLAETVFSARVNALDGIQRIRVSADDAGGPAGDYTDEQSVTNDLAVITPYVVTFRCFTPELARVISAFATSSNTFLIKAVNVQPAGASDVAGAAESPDQGAAAAAVYGRYGRYRRSPDFPPPAAAPAPAKGGLQTVLKEQLLRVTIEVGFVNLLPKS